MSPISEAPPEQGYEKVKINPDDIVYEVVTDGGATARFRDFLELKKGEEDSGSGHLNVGAFNTYFKLELPFPKEDCDVTAIFKRDRTVYIFLSREDHNTGLLAHCGSNFREYFSNIVNLDS